MPNPKRRHSNTRTRLRRAHDALKIKSLSKCSHCGASIIPHRLCKHCGYYKGKRVLTLKVKSKKEAAQAA